MFSPISLKIAIVGSAFSLFFNQTAAQNSYANNGSPYSKFGLGDLQTVASVSNRAMGNIGIAVQNPLYTNLVNPASFGSLSLTTFSTSFSTKLTQISSGLQQQVRADNNLAYATLSFPVAKFWGVGVGVMPYTDINYAITSYIDDGERSRLLSYKGSGGLNRYYIANGFELLKKRLYLGVSASYLVGNLDYYERLEFVANSLAVDPFVNIQIVNQQRDNGFLINAGLQYKQKIKQNNFLTIGLIGDVASSLKTNQTYSALRYRSLNIGDFIVDSLFSTKKISTVALPTHLGAGLTYELSSKLLLSVEASQQNWATFKALDDNEDSLSNSFSINFGASITPDINANTIKMKNYWKVVSYRFGAQYQQTNLPANLKTNISAPVNQFGITFGVSLPLRKSFSQIHFAAELGQRGNLKQNNIIEEKYGKLTVGFTLDDRWFIKRKYD